MLNALKLDPRRPWKGVWRWFSEEQMARVRVLDTARFKYPPHGMPVELLFDAIVEQDADTGLARGWLRVARAAS